MTGAERDNYTPRRSLAGVITKTRTGKSSCRDPARIVDVDHPQAEDAVAHAEAARLVGAFLETLRPDKRAAFTLIDLEGNSAPEVPDVLGIKLNTVYSRLRVARQRFEWAIAPQNRRSSWSSNES